MKYSQQLKDVRKQVQTASNFDNKPYLKQIDKLVFSDAFISKKVWVGYFVGLVMISYGLFSSWNLLTLKEYPPNDVSHFSSPDWEEGYYTFKGALLNQHALKDEYNYILFTTFTYFFTPVVSANYKKGDKIRLLIPIQQAQIDRIEKEHPKFRMNATPIRLRGVVKRDVPQDIVDQLLKKGINVSNDVGILHQTSVKKDFQLVLFFVGVGTILWLIMKSISFLSRRAGKKELDRLRKELTMFGIF